MPIQPFKLERYFAQYEFHAKYLLSSSDCESLGMGELADMASLESRQLWENLKLGYTESQGHPLLRAEIAKLYERIDAENALVAAPEEAIFVAMQTLLEAGDHVIAIAPAYQSLYEIARSIGCQVTPWNLEVGSAGWELDLKRQEQSITRQTKLLVLNFPNNPTGYHASRQELDAIVGLARKHGIAIFSDEMYRLLEYSPDLRLPSIADVYEKGVSLSGLSKSFALPGLRIGWLVTQQRQLLDGWLMFKDYTTICNSAPSEILALIALQNSGWIVQRSLEIVRQNVALAESFFNRHANTFSCHLPQAGSVAMVEWRGSGSVEAFCQGVLDHAGVMIVPGRLFDLPGNYFRIGLGRRNFGEALGHVEAYLASISSKN